MTTISINWTGATTEDLLATIERHPEGPSTAAASREYLRRTWGIWGHYADKARALLAKLDTP